jgi:hypothetical protein
MLILVNQGGLMCSLQICDDCLAMQIAKPVIAHHRIRLDVPIIRQKKPALEKASFNP